MGEMTAALYGHSHPVLVSAIQDALTGTGLNLGGSTTQDHAHAAAMCERFGLQRVRFANSGTEANLHMLAAARAFMGKKRVVVFSGGYHGGVFTFAGGVPARNAVDQDCWVVARYNDVESARKAIFEGDVAAVLVEGMQGGPGAIPGTNEFLLGIQDAAKEVCRFPSRVGRGRILGMSTKVVIQDN
jgi:glutamate-1-semialdehyde 2,1-aminomutase